MVSFYEEIGFLPEAILNALARLGWSYDDKTENMPLDFIVENFTLDRVVKASAGFDPDKLLAFQEHWVAQRPLEERVDRCLPYLQRVGWIGETASNEERDYVQRLLVALADRIKVFSDIVGYDEYFVADDALTYDEKALEKRVRKSEVAVTLLRGFRDQLATTESFVAADLDALLHQFVESQGAKIGDIIHALRLAVTGKPAGPGMFDCLELLGRDRCLNRIDLLLAKVN